jgi:foldase protein PrsA
VILIVIAGCGRERDKTVADVDGMRITAGEFRERYAKYLSSTGVRDNILARKQILENMISERLVERDIVRQKLDRRPDFQHRMEEIRRQALLDRYAQRISVDTLTVAEEETREEFRRYQTKAVVRYLYAPTLEGSRALKQRLASGESFQDLAKEVFTDPGLAGNGGFLGTVGWGDLESGLEEATYTQPIGSVSEPIRIAIGYALLKVERRLTEPLASEYDYEKARLTLERAILDRKVKKTVAAASRGVADGLHPEFDDSVVGAVFERWRSLGAGPDETSTTDPFPAGLRGATMVRFASGAWTVGEFLARADWTTEKQRRRVKNVEDVRSVAVGLAVRDELLKRAVEQGLESDSGVVRQRARMELEFRLRYWASMVQDTVGRGGWPDSVLLKQYAVRRAEMTVPPEVNVAEILVRTEDEARGLLKKLRSGGSFSDLARKHSVRLNTAAQGGELGWGTSSMFGPLGEKFLKARVGEVVGPEVVDPYYGLFKILGHREGRPLSFEEARVRLAEDIAEARKKEVLRTAVFKLRDGTSITTDTKVLEFITL